MANQLASNGESMLQRCVVEATEAGAPLVVFDVGANRGDWTLSILALCARAPVALQVHAFEPSAYTRELLEGALAGHPLRDRVSVEPMALSDQEGEAQLFVPEPGAGTTTLSPDADTGAYQSVETTRLSTVDAFCQRAGIAQIPLLKCDAEGHDALVIDGAMEMFRAQRIGILQFEYNQRWINSRRYLKDVFEQLGPLGYAVGKLTPAGVEFYPGWDWELESYREGNYIACLPHWRRQLPEVRWWKLA